MFNFIIYQVLTFGWFGHEEQLNGERSDSKLLLGASEWIKKMGTSHEDITQSS